MSAIEDWSRAEQEVRYKIKEDALALSKGRGISYPEALQIVQKNYENEIKQKSFDRYWALLDKTLDNWYRAEEQINNSQTCLNKIEEQARYNASTGFDLNAAREIIRIEFVRVAAYYIWEKYHKQFTDWILSENSFKSEIESNAERILKKKPYLTKEEAWYCARDDMRSKIEAKANRRQSAIEKAAYIQSLKHPNRSMYENWVRAAQDYDKMGEQ